MINDLKASTEDILCSSNLLVSSSSCNIASVLVWLYCRPTELNEEWLLWFSFNQLWRQGLLTEILLSPRLK